MTTTKEQIAQAVREWLKHAKTTGVALTDAQVIMGDAAGTAGNPTAARPPMPYLTVKILTEQAIGDDELVIGEASYGVPNVRTRGERKALASVQAFGDDAVDWLRLARLRLRLPAVQDNLTTLGISVSVSGPWRDLTALRDSSMESRAVQEFEIGYTLVSDTDTALPVERVAITIDLNDTAPGTIVETFTEELP